MAYDILLPSIPVLLGYILTHALYKAGLIRKSLYVNIWNMVLLATIIISGLAGFVLLILLDMGIVIPISPQLLYLHAEFGITLTIVTLFHLHTHWKSSKAMFIQAKMRSES
jgi:hypothetical protein